MIQISEVTKNYGHREILAPLSLTIPDGEWVAIIGPSGCGKSTVLSMLGGFEPPTGGLLSTGGAKVRSVFQDDALLPWLTLGENLALGVRHYPRGERDAQVQALAAVTGLQDDLHHYPHELSGGMRQRGQFAWALASDANVLLMDEPFSALDSAHRSRLREEMVEIFSRRRCTVVLVTHELYDALHIADRLVVLGGRPAQVIADLRVHLPRPRDLRDPRLAALHAQLTTTMATAGYSAPSSMRG